MSDQQIIIAATVLCIAGLAVFCTLFRMAREKNRLWGRYQHVKAVMQRQDYFRDLVEQRRQRPEDDGVETVTTVGPDGQVGADATPTVHPVGAATASAATPADGAAVG